MSETNWGPAEAVARELGGAEGPRSWRRGAWGPGGLWTAAARQGGVLWPAEILAVDVPAPRKWLARPNAVPIRSRGFFEAFCEWLRRLFGQRHTSTPTPMVTTEMALTTAQAVPAAPAAPDSRTSPLITKLIALHAWVGAENLRAAANWFTPFWYDTPTPLASATQQGAAWTMLAYHLATWGPEDNLAGLDTLLRPSTSTTPADCLALHLHIERLVSQASERLRLDPTGLCPRRPGGLRTQSLLTIWPCLASSPDGEKWRAELQRLADVSPLTQLVYADLLTAVPGTAKPGLLFPAVAGAAEGSAWLDLWLSQLARSLLGAVLSPSPSCQALLDAEQRLQAARARTTNGAADPAVVLAQKDHDQWAEKVRFEYRIRLTGIGAMLAASVFFTLRFTDMLIRQIVADCVPQIEQAWKRLKITAQEEARNLFFFPYAKVAKEDRICFLAFERVLFGPGRMPTNAADQDLRQVLFTFLPRGEPDEKSLAAESGVPVQRCRDLFARYHVQQVALPIRSEVGHTPAYILKLWIRELLDRIPSPPPEASVEADA